VVLGSGGKRLVYAVAGGDRAAALPGGDREARELPRLDVLLAIAAFSLCLLGTFLVRSGVLVSVHAFASDPSRGLFILALLVVAIGGSLLLYALKGAGCGRGSNIRCGRASRSCLATIFC
jgi:cytochrome c biogenesis factor